MAKTTHRAPERIEPRSVDALVPYARNARTHSDAQVAQIAASIREFGWTNPLLISADGTIIAGHGRLAAARKLGMVEVPCIVLDHLTETQRRALVIADNKLAMNAGWDDEALALELRTLLDDGFSLPLLGFEKDDVTRLLAEPENASTTNDPDSDADAVPEMQARIVSRRGDVWTLGRQRLACGDSTSADDVGRLMAGSVVGLCFTSPPYGQQRDYTAEATEQVQDWDALMRGVFAQVPLADDGQILVNLGLIHRKNEWMPYWDGWMEWMRSQGLRRFGLYVWDQGCGMPGDWTGRCAPSFELVFHFNRNAVKPAKWVDKQPGSIGVRHKHTMRRKDGTLREFSSPEASAQETKLPDSVWRVNRLVGGNSGLTHPAMFPVALPTFAMSTWTGDVYEPFSGSGTTLLAAEQLGRKCYAMDIAPEYVDMAVRRWQDFTGRSATLEGDGRTFDELAAERSTP